MNFWLSVHWPLPVNVSNDVEWRNWLFLAKGWEQRALNEVRPGDFVFVYETENGPAARKGNAFVPKSAGRKGIVAFVRVRTSLQDNPDTEAEVLEDGRVRCWRFRAVTQTIREGNLHLTAVRQALGLPGFSAQIPGGLMKLTEEQFDRILERFLKIG